MATTLSKIDQDFLDKIESLEIKTVEMHTGGEALRIITSGYPMIEGNTILEKRKYVQENLDIIRMLVMREPRGHAEMYGAILVEPDDEKADLAVLFIHNGGYSVMCGHAVIALARYAVDSGLVKIDHSVTTSVPVFIQCPCGMVKAMVEVNEGRSGMAKFTSVPAFAYGIDVKVTSKVYGNLTVDIGYGGTFYALVTDKQLGLDIRSSAVSELVAAAKEMLECCREQIKLVTDAVDKDLVFMYGVIVTDGKNWHNSLNEPTRNMCYFGNGQVDRSPTGSGVTARVAVQYHKKQISLNQSREFESIIGAKFTGSPIKETKCGEFPAVLVEVGGMANYSGKSVFTVEKNDPFMQGFLI